MSTSDGFPGQTGIDLYDDAIHNGFHNFVVNAWDTEGHLYQARTEVTVTGLSFGSCPIPKSPGINFCAPPANVVLPVNPEVIASATGTSPIRSLNFYVDGVLAASVPNNVPNDNSFGVASGYNFRSRKLPPQ